MARAKSSAILEKELIVRLSMITGHGKDIVKDVISALSEFVIDEISNETPVTIGKLGEICIQTYQGRGGFSFLTGKMLPPKPITRIKFRPSASLKRAIEGISEQREQSNL